MRTAWPQPDFLAAPRTRRPASAWVWGATGLVVAAFALNDWRSAQHALAVQRERLARNTQRAPVVAPRPRAAAPGASVPDADALRAAQAVVGRIAHPWDQILANVEAEAPDGLQWLALDHDADDVRVRLEGTAGDVATVLHFVDNLADHAGWSDVVLGRLSMAERGDAVAGAPAWRFELRATIDPRRVAQARPAGER